MRDVEDHPSRRTTGGLRESHTFDRHAIAEIQRAAREGIYDIRGGGAKRRVPHFDDLLFLGASVSRYPLEGYRERCGTDVVLGTRFAKQPLHLDIPVTIAGMSFGALSANAKEALGRGASAVGTSTTTGDGGMTPEERLSSKTLVYQVLPSRYGMNPDDLRRADAIEIVVGQGAKPGGGGMLLGQKISDRVAEMRDLPAGIDQRSACRHPDWTGPDDLEIKIEELREITDWQKPIFVKVGASRPYYDVALAVKSGADVIVMDGMQGGTAATQDVFIEHVGIPILAAIPQAVEALQELRMHRTVQLVVSGARRQRTRARRRVREARLGGGLLRRLARGSRSGGHLDPGPGAGRPAGSRAGGPAPGQLPAHDRPRSADPGPRLRQVPRAQPRARGPGRVDHRVVGDGPRAPGRHELDPRPRAALSRCPFCSPAPTAGPARSRTSASAASCRPDRPRGRRRAS